MQRFTFLVFIMVLAGCGSTPYRDDYTKHVNLVKNQFNEPSSLTFTFDGGDSVDLRGHYDGDDEVGQTAILYQGGAGLVGLIAQIGLHASLVDSTRDDKLAVAQQEANAQIQTLIDQVQRLSLPLLLDDMGENLVTRDTVNTQTLRLRPIFFSKPDMSQLMLKLVAWIPHPKGGKNTSLYQNMIEVHGGKFAAVTALDDNTKQGDVLAQSLAVMLKKALQIALNDVTGVYQKSNGAQASFFIEQNNKTRVIRGSVVEENCDYQVVQDLHSWFIAIPVEQKESLVACNI
ncbi:hypothetical protein [Paraglaciecola sp.]|uniref:hypothetical protein n=1 Tax=Paraglaciecola sp. TaxID=1920173 RepID=UPI00273F32A2|nr:hypothetical protein [Paraglaciecola sp.]MDP5032236.1 hypothetical protein [Paraglaciecola sp.]